MRRFLGVFAAAILVTASMGFSQDTTSPTRQGSALRIEEAYRAAGASEEQIKKLQEYDQQIREARKDPGPEGVEKAKQAREAKQKILSQEQRRKLGEYIRAQMQTARSDKSTTAQLARSQTTTTKQESTTNTK